MLLHEYVGKDLFLLYCNVFIISVVIRKYVVAIGIVLWVEVF